MSERDEPRFPVEQIVVNTTHQSKRGIYIIAEHDVTATIDILPDDDWRIADLSYCGVYYCFGHRHEKLFPIERTDPLFAEIETDSAFQTTVSDRIADALAEERNAA